jgi:cytochrome c oxidase subunit III
VASPAATSRRPSVLAIGSVVWLASEAMFFAGLFAAWFFVRTESAVWPPEGVHLDVPRTALATAVLVVSSFTMHAAHKASGRGHDALATRWVLLTALLAAVFLGNQALEWGELDFQVSSHAYGTLFYVLTGFHGLHVLAGVVLMLTVVGAAGGRSRMHLDEPLLVTSYYWHFVDVVWVAMFLVIYVVR